MRLEGIHHVTAITGDAPGNVDFYARVLGLRLVKKTVNQDDPTVYHLFYADERGSAGSDITFFEYPGARRGRAGAGMVHRVVFRVASEEALDFWEERLRAERRLPLAQRRPTDLRGSRGAGPRARGRRDRPTSRLTAEHPEIPAEHRIQGFDSVRAYTQDPETSREFLEGALEFESRGDKEFEVRGERRGGTYVYDQTDERGVPGAGNGPPRRVGFDARGARGLAPAGDRGRRLADARSSTASTSSRSTSASRAGSCSRSRPIGPGFTTDEPLESLGERLSLPPNFEHLREQVEPVLTPITNPRESWATR